MSTEVPRYEITHNDVAVEAVVVEIDGKTIVQPVEPLVVLAGDSFTISGGARTVTLDCAANEAHDIEPTAPASPDAHGWAPLPPECPVTGWPQFDNPDLDMCSCGHQHITVQCWGEGGSEWT